MSNIDAFLRVIRAGESNQDDSAFTLINGGGHFDSFDRHPFEHLKTTEGGKASGAYQIIPTTWDDFCKATGHGASFAPADQTQCALWLISRRHATADVDAGDIPRAIAKLADEWVSLPHLGVATASKIFTNWGGTLAGVAPEPVPAPPPPITTGAKTMDPISLLAIFGPILSQLIPQIGKLFGGKKDQQNVAAIGTVFDTIVKATGDAGITSVGSVGAAIEKMQADPKVKEEVVKAVVTHPDILPFMEVGGGVAAARAHDVQVMQSDKPFWKASAVFFISLILLPMVYWYVGSSIVGGIEVPANWPWFPQFVLKMFGTGWSLDARSGLANLVLGLVLGGICGVYYGVSVTQQKQAQTSDTEKSG